MIEITISAVLVCMVTSILLGGYSILDICNQQIPNRLVLAGGLIGFIVVIFSGHLLQDMILHVTSILFMMVVGYALFRIGSFGGADVKIVILVSIVSPGLEFISWENPVLEAVLIAGLQIIMTLVGGYGYSKIMNWQERKKPIPLIPFLLVAYLLLQLLALF